MYPVAYSLPHYEYKSSVLSGIMAAIHLKMEAELTPYKYSTSPKPVSLSLFIFWGSATLVFGVLARFL